MSIKLTDNGKKVVKISCYLTIGIIGLILCFGSFETIQEGSVGVKYRFGSVVEEGLPSGMNFKLPFIDRIETIDITEQSVEYTEDAYTKDIQTLEAMTVKINYQYDTHKLSNLIRNIGIHNIENKLIKPQVQSVLKNEIGKYKAEELVANRTKIQEDVEDIIRGNVNEYGINIISVSIQNMNFDESFEKVIAEKVASEQKLLTAKTEAQKAQVEAEGIAKSKRIQADAESYAINAISRASSKASRTYIKLEKIKMLKEKWDGKMPRVMTKGNSDILLNVSNDD